MRITSILSVVVILSLGLLATDEASARIYKWVDDKGNVHFGERPPTDGNAEEIKTRQTHITDDQAKAQLKALTDKSSESSKNREVVEQDQQQAEAVDARRKENCEIAQNNLKLLESKNRVQTKGEDGEKFYLDDDTRQHKISLSKKQIAEFCG
ncbi:MAG: DUF4124 domain-containing protein [Pseudomonadota bacterium]